jgi:hypothetical protein
MFRILLPLALALAAILPAAAADYVPVEQRLSSQQLHETGLDTLSPAQLARLNALLRDEDAARAEAAVAREAELAEARAAAAAAPGAAPAADPHRFAGMDDGPIRARVQGTVAGWTEGDEFTLDNGQVWKVLKGHLQLPRPVENPQVVVVPGVAGRWFLQFDEDLPKARVYRID